MDAGKMNGIFVGSQLAGPKGRKIWRYCAGALALATALSVAGCYGPPMGPRERDTLIGGAVGVGGGALVGSAVGSPGTGAVLGGLLGAGSGYLIGNQAEAGWGPGGWGPGPGPGPGPGWGPGDWGPGRH